jgi:hypothetical protein
MKVPKIIMLYLENPYAFSISNCGAEVWGFIYLHASEEYFVNWC